MISKLGQDWVHQLSAVTITRRGLLAAAAAGAVGTRLASAQVIRETPVTEDIGQLPGEAVTGPIEVEGRVYDAYLRAAVKEGQDFSYTCEFDASWVVLKTHEIDVTLEEQLEVVGHDQSIEPYYQESASGVVIYGGDIAEAYSGDYKENFLARSTGLAMRKIFDHYDLKVTPIHEREDLEAALLQGELMWMKATVDFLPWVPATWITPDGSTFETVLGNDHALVVMGFNSDNVVIRDPLGPTTTNWERPFQYEVDWPTFMAVWEAQEFDGLAVGPPDEE